MSRIRQQPLKNLRAWPVRRQLLVTVNTALFLFVVLFLAIDYRRELSARVEQKRVALQEEAKTLLPAVQRLRTVGLQEVQQHLDAVCSQMVDSESPSHHVVARVGESVLQATAHRRASPDIYSAMQRAAVAADGRTSFRGRDMIVGTARLGEITTFVSEESTLLQAFVLWDVIWRFLGIIGLGMVAAVATSAVLVREISRPLTSITETVSGIARGDLSSRAEQGNNRELRIMATAINSMAEKLESDERDRALERKQARQIQEHLLPVQLDAPGLSVAALYRPAAQVAGDYYDVLPMADGTWLVCIADVSGHGVPAAMSAAILKTLVVYGAEHNSDPGELLGFINRRFAALSPLGQFASMLLLRWMPSEDYFEFASAGHEPGYVCSGDHGTSVLRATGTLLGIDDQEVWETQRVAAAPGDALLLITDGVSESTGPSGEMFGRHRFVRLCDDCGTTAEELVQRIDAELSLHAGTVPAMDDITILAARITSVPLPEPALAPPSSQFANGYTP